LPPGRTFGIRVCMRVKFVDKKFFSSNFFVIHVIKIYRCCG
jgi:hypothetical protein